MKKNKLSKKEKTVMHVKKGDTVQIISGKEKGKIGEITTIIRKKHQIIVKGINIKIKHTKARSENEAGQITQIEAPIDSSNVMLYSKTSKICSRIEYTIDEASNKKVRQLKKNKEIIL
uniref:ribosomal protein L24 n=1 Tax=Erythrolobus coxiae TaxID=362235 RepID=UPI001FCD5537|nr:ribosomal protein L24 [Erythrolobus coxiae]UNJ17744.1 ribosomal protein L24 [Erythrolobus coxiae]